MCGRFIMVDRDEVKRIAADIARDLADHAGELETLDPIESFGPFLSQPQPPSGPDGRADARPSSVVPLIAPTAHGAQLAVADMAWGFDMPWTKGLVFNTRIETALGKPDGVWGASLARRRCIVAAWAFYEPHASETVPSERTGRPVKRQYRFERRDGGPMLLAGIHDKGRFSIVTTEPDDTVAPVHDRMPLTLESEDAALWLAGRHDELSGRPGASLIGLPER